MKLFIPTLIFGMASLSLADTRIPSFNEQERWLPYLEQEAFYGHLDSIKKLVMDHHDVSKAFYINDTSERPMTALAVASFEGHLEVVRYLIEQGSDINFHGAKLDAFGAKGETALIGACRGGHLDCAKLLLDAGAEINATDEYGQTALSVTSNTALIELLLQRGAKVNHKNIDGVSPLMYNARLGGSDQAKLLIEAGANVNDSDDDGDTALFFASIYGQDSVIKLLIEHGADITLQNKAGERALDVAKERAHTGRTIQLLSPALTAQDDREAYFDQEVYYGHLDSIKALVAQGLDVTKPYQDGKTALQIACAEGNTEVAQYLIEQGCDVNRQAAPTDCFGYHGESALMIACYHGQLDCIKLLIQHGAKLEQRDAIGRTALLYACSYDCTKNRGETIRYLIEQGCDVKVTSQSDNEATPLLALFLPSKEILELLLKAGADPNAQNRGGYTILMQACCYQREELIPILLKYGADTTIKNKLGRTALDIAKERNWQAYKCLSSHSMP